MFRTALFRTAALRSTTFLGARAAAPAASTAARTATPVARAAAVPVSVRLQRAPGQIRFYSAGGALSKKEVEERIMGLLQGFDKVNDPKNITSSSHFANDLGLDSLDTVEVVMAIEEEFSIEIPDKDADAIHSVGQAIEYILHQPDAH